MICRGHLPLTFAGSKTQVGTDTKRFVQYFMKKGVKFTRSSVMNVCRSLHLAFKGMESEEIYDILMQQLLRAARKYDPFYSDKVGKVVEVLSRKRNKKTGTDGRPRQLFLVPKPVLTRWSSELSKKDFTIDDLNQYLNFDCVRFVRVLCRHGFLETSPNQSNAVCPDRQSARASAGQRIPHVRAYRRTAAWPPPAEYLSAGAIGFAYYLQMWFRYYLQQHIESAMSELEVREGTYSLDFNRHIEDRSADGLDATLLGSPVDHDGKWWTSQRITAGAEKPRLGGCDLSQMTLDWVAETEDPIFIDLSRQDRYLLYMYFEAELQVGADRRCFANIHAGNDAQGIGRGVHGCPLSIQQLARYDPDFCHPDGGCELPGGPRRSCMINLTVPAPAANLQRAQHYLEEY